MSSGRLRPSRHAVGDVFLAGVFVLAAEIDIWVRGTVAGPRLENAVLLAFVGIPLLWRRRRPELTVLTIAAATVTQAVAVGHPPSGFLYWPILVGAYSLGAHAPLGRRSIAAVAALTAAYAYLTSVWMSGSSGLSVTDVPWMFSPLLAWAAGRFMRRRRAHAAADADAARAEREREQQRLAALEHERGRMARELHDILAHSVSVMGVQAGAAEEVLAVDPERARPVLRSIQLTARDSVGELRRLLGMLRADDVGPELTPQPGLHDLESLVARMRETGLPIELRTDGPLEQVPPGVELTAYRVVQEALTNALKHARPTRVVVALRFAAGVLEVTVANNGVNGNVNGHGTGQGLIGMQERVTLYGGTLHASPGPAGEFRVRAEIPLEHAPA